MNPKICKNCSSNQTVVSSNQKYLYCLNCSKSNFYRCFCGSFNFQPKEENPDSIKCNHCGLHSYVPEHIMADPEAVSFVQKSHQLVEKRKSKKFDYNIKSMNLVLILGVILFWYNF